MGDVLGGEGMGGGTGGGCQGGSRVLGKTGPSFSAKVDRGEDNLGF